ncbi:hypothetical protein Tco_1395378, partial [Tanacetum coccineum]
LTAMQQEMSDGDLFDAGGFGVWSDLCGLWLKRVFLPLIALDLDGEATSRVCSHVGCINVLLDLCGSLAGQHHGSGVCSQHTIAFAVDGSRSVKSAPISVGSTSSCLQPWRVAYPFLPSRIGKSEPKVFGRSASAYDSLL